MNHIPILVIPFSDVVIGASIDLKRPDDWGKVKSCYNCGGLPFYQVTVRVEGTELASDTHIYCAICGKDNGGMFDDPLNEMNPCSNHIITGDEK